MAGLVTWFVVADQLGAENITVSEDADFLAGSDVTGPFSAYAQAQVINKHARTDCLAGTVASTSPGADPVVVDPDHEARQLTEVQERLQARFPEVDPTVVAAAIQVAASQITGPIREFVPLLVERAARARLERALSGEATPTTEVERAEKRHGSAAADAG